MYIDKAMFTRQASIQYAKHALLPLSGALSYNDLVMAMVVLPYYQRFCLIRHLYWKRGFNLGFTLKTCLSYSVHQENQCFKAGKTMGIHVPAMF